MKKSYNVVKNSKIVNREANRAYYGVISSAVGYSPEVEARIDAALGALYFETNQLSLNPDRRERLEVFRQDHPDESNDDFWDSEPTAAQLAAIEQEGN